MLNPFTNPDDFCADCPLYEEFVGIDEAYGAPMACSDWECSLGETPDKIGCKFHQEWLDLNGDEDDEETEEEELS